MIRSRPGLCLLLLLALPAAHAAEGPQTEQQRIAALEARVQSLEAELQQIKSALQSDPSRVASGEAARPPSSLQDEIDALAANPGQDRFDERADDPEADILEPGDPASLAATIGGGDVAASNGANAFNPAISIVLNGSYSHHSLDPDAYERAGFPLVGEGGPSANGFSLGESEISFAANIDDKLFGQLTLAIGSEDGQDEIGVEEAFIDTTSLPYGFGLRAGRFFSNIGYLNSHHRHTDSFFDRPLVYQAFLGNQFSDDGLQLRWVAPTSLFVELGGEVFRGEAYPAAGAQRSGLGARTLFAHVGGDAGVESEWLVGVSRLDTSADGAEDGFSGDGTLHIADATWKWAPQGNFKDGGITVRGEYFNDRRDGIYQDPFDPVITSQWVGKRSGFYLEGVYRFSRRWDAGYRYGKLWADETGPFASAFDPYRNSVELTWRNSEFSLLRIQFARDNANPDETDNAIFLQYQTNLGAHGAHKF